MHSPATNCLKLTGVMAGLSGFGYWLFPKLMLNRFGMHLLMTSRLLGQSLLTLSIFLALLWQNADVATQRVTCFACICCAGLIGFSSEYTRYSSGSHAVECSGFNLCVPVAVSCTSAKTRRLQRPRSDDW